MMASNREDTNNSMTTKFAALALFSLGIAEAAFGQAKNADSMAARLQKVEDRQAIEQLLMGDYRGRFQALRRVLRHRLVPCPPAATEASTWLRT